MKKVLMTLGGVFLVLIVLFVVGLIWAQRAGSALQEKFFTAILSGEPKQVTALFGPSLREEVDEPVLAAWMAEVKAQLGSWKGLSATHFNTATKSEGGVQRTDTVGTVEFEKGQAHSELVWRDGQLIGFKIESEKLKDWFTGPASTELYRERGKEFLTAFLGGEPDKAFARMHESLQKLAPIEKLKTMAAGILANAGRLQSVAYSAEKAEPGDPYALTISYKVACERTSTTATAKFQFVGMKGHLVAFNVQGSRHPPDPEE